MKLYSKPGACSTAAAIALQWIGQPFELTVMTAEAMKTPEFRALNPAGTVPVLVDGDFVLTQNVAILGYLADSCPEAKLAGDGSIRQRAQAARWLAYVNADLHPAFHPLFEPGRFLADESRHEALKQAAHTRLRGIFERAEQQLEGKRWIAGFRSFADPYLYITLRWAQNTHVDLSGFDHVAAFKQHMENDSGVQAALKAEGLT